MKDTKMFFVSLTKYSIIIWFIWKRLFRKIKNLLTSTVQAVRGNIKPQCCCSNLAIAPSIQQDFSQYYRIFSSTVLTLSQ